MQTDQKVLPADHYLPLRELARYSGLSVRTLRSYLVNSTAPLPHYRVGGRVLVRRSEFDMWAQRFRRASAGILDTMVDDIMKTLAK